MPLDAQLMDRLFQSPQLPSLPAIALQIIELVQQDEVDVDKIAGTISLDPALSTKMLKTVNSSFYGLPKTIGSVHQAVVVLGLNSVKTLALGFSLVGNLTEAGGAGLDPMRFWRRSLYSATAAKQLCERLHVVQAEEVFIASLLQDVGVLALAQVLDAQYTQLIDRSADHHRGLAPLEREALGGTHMEVGAALAESWGLPPLLVESIRLHETPDEAPENLLRLIRTVSAGGLAAELIAYPDDETRVTEYYDLLGSWFDLDRASADDLLRQVFKNASETQRLFELPTGELGSADEIMSRAARALEQIGEPGASAPSPQAPAAAQGPAPLDQVTQLHGRRRFEELLDERFLAAGGTQPLSVILVDLDHFKQVNDKHGWRAGDSVLAGIGRALRDHAGERGEVCRYSIDQFAVLCPSLQRADAALLAEALRVQVEQTACAVGESDSQASVMMTASVGVACYEGSVFKRAEQLIKAAEKGVAAAKQGGRNAVRVFVPKAGGKSKAA